MAPRACLRLRSMLWCRGWLRQPRHHRDAAGHRAGLDSRHARRADSARGSLHRVRQLQREAARAGNVEPGRNARALTELAPPEIRWAELARSLGVPGMRIEAAEAMVTF